MRYILLFLLVGCTNVPDMTPMVVVSLGIASDGQPEPPKPTEDCENCGGLGYLGDSVIKRDCPECEIPWSISPEDIVKSNVEISASIQELRDSLQAVSAKLDTMQSCPVPVMEINDAKVLAERLWEEFEENYQERFYEGFKKYLTVEEVRKEGVLTEQVLFTDYADAIREATNRDCILLLVFSSRTCAPCDQLKAAQDSVPLTDMVVCRLYAEENPDLFRNYGITTYPTQIVRYRSRELARVSGAMNRNYFYQWIEKFKATAPSIMPR